MLQIKVHVDHAIHGLQLALWKVILKLRLEDYHLYQDSKQLTALIDMEIEVALEVGCTMYLTMQEVTLLILLAHILIQVEQVHAELVAGELELLGIPWYQETIQVH